MLAALGELQPGANTPEPRGKRSKTTSGAKSPEERFGPPDSTGKGHIWLLVTSESSLFSTLLTHWPRKRRSAEDFQFPQAFCSSKDIRDAPEEEPRVLTWCSQVSARADSPHLKSPKHDSTAKQVSVVLLPKELATLVELLWAVFFFLCRILWPRANSFF